MKQEIVYNQIWQIRLAGWSTLKSKGKEVFPTTMNDKNLGKDLTVSNLLKILVNKELKKSLEGVRNEHDHRRSRDQER